MRQVKAQTFSGEVSFEYVISTPRSEDAECIDPSLPTILFLHPIYVGKIVFHYQFADPRLRRFNLVALDDRSHGPGPQTWPVPSTYRTTDMADDVSSFMNALQLPPCHIAGISLGAAVALELALRHPNQVLSLFMLSPLSLNEPEEVAAGRQEIFECWEAGVKGETPDNSAVLDAIFGALQLAFNDPQASIVSSLVKYSIPRSQLHWSPDRLDELHTVAVDAFVDRKPPPIDVLRRVAGCPIHLVHGLSDIAYSPQSAEELRDYLASGGIDVKLSMVEDAPHYGCVTHFTPINNLLHDWVMEQTESDVPKGKPRPKSPFAVALFKAGFKDSGNGSSDEDDLVPL